MSAVFLPPPSAPEMPLVRARGFGCKPARAGGAQHVPHPGAWAEGDLAGIALGRLVLFLLHEERAVARGHARTRQGRR